MSTIGSTYDHRAVGTGAATADRTRSLFGQVMGYVAVTVGFTALGAYLGRDLAGGTGVLVLLASFAVVFGLNVAAARRQVQLSIGLLFGLGLLLGVGLGPVLADYASADPSALWQAAGATAAFVAATGAYGYATRRDLASWDRTLFWALLGLLLFGTFAILVSIPGANVIYAVAGLGVFGAYTIFDFNRLRRSSPDTAVVIAAGIFLDILNIFLFALDLFSGQRD